jgi:hypothetical protein
MTTATLMDLTPLLLKERQVWQDLIEAFDQVYSDNVESGIRTLEQLRFLPPGTDIADCHAACTVCRSERH